MSKEGEKPDFLDGLCNEFFFGVPYSPFLTRSEQSLRQDVQRNTLLQQQVIELQKTDTGYQMINQPPGTSSGTLEMVEATKISNILLTGIGQELHETNRSINILQGIATAQLETSERIENALWEIQRTLEEQGAYIASIIEGVRATLYEIEERTIEREYNRNQIDGDEKFRIALDLLKIEEVDEAIKWLDKSRESYPLAPKVYFHRGLCRITKNEVRKAKADFSQALKTASNEGQERIRATARLNLARIYYSESKIYHEQEGEEKLSKEKLLEAIAETRKAVEEDQNILESKFTLATYLATLGTPEALAEALKILFEIIPEEPVYAVKLKHFDVFKPLEESLSYTLAEDFAQKMAEDVKENSKRENRNYIRKNPGKESEFIKDLQKGGWQLDDINKMIEDAKKDKTQEGKKTPNSKLVANITIARDAMKAGNPSVAIQCLKWLIQKVVFFLHRLKFWEIEEFKSIHTEIGQMIKQKIENEIKSRSNRGETNYWLALASMAMHFDPEEAFKCIENILNQEGLSYLHKSKFWEIEEFKVFHSKIAQRIIKEIDTSESHQCINWYTRAAIALYFDEIPQGKIYNAFLKGTEHDSSFEYAKKHWYIEGWRDMEEKEKEEFIEKFITKLSDLAGEKTEKLFKIIKTKHPVDFEWFITKL